MRLRPSSSAHYCLGGPYQSLTSLQSLFPDGTLMLQEIDSYLSDWRESAHDLTNVHSLLSDPSNLIYEIEDANKPSQEHADVTSDEIILSIDSIDDKDCDCDRPFLNGTVIVVCCNKRAELFNKLQAVFFCGRSQAELKYQINHSQSKPYSRVDWLEDMNAVLLDYQSHLSTCSIRHTENILQPFIVYSPCEMRLRMGRLFRLYESDFDLSQSMQFLKSAMCHLDTCMTIEPRLRETHRPNTFIAFRCDEKFSNELRTFQDFFLTFYPEFKQAMVPGDSAHITVLAFKLPSEKALQTAGLAFATAWNNWLDEFPFQTIGSMSMSFTGTGMFDNKVLYLKPTAFNNALISLHSMLLAEFQRYGFECDERMTPHLTFAKLKPNSVQSFPEECVDVFSEVAAGTTIFQRIEMLSMKKVNNDYPCLKALAFSKDLTLPKTDLIETDRFSSPILTFHSSDQVIEQETEVTEESNIDKPQDTSDNLKKTLSDPFDALSRNDGKISNGISSVGHHDKQTQWDDSLEDVTNQNLGMFTSELPDSNVQLFVGRLEFRPSTMSPFDDDQWLQKTQDRHDAIDNFELTTNDIQLFVEDQTSTYQ